MAMDEVRHRHMMNEREYYPISSSEAVSSGELKVGFTGFALFFIITDFVQTVADIYVIVQKF